MDGVVEGNEKVINFQDDSGEEIDQNYEDLENNPKKEKEKVINSIFEGIDEKYKTDNLKKETFEVYEKFEIKNFGGGVKLMNSIIIEALNFSKFNLSSRLLDFFKFILDIKNSKKKLEYIKEALKKKAKNLEKGDNKDIIYYWKKYIAEEYLKENSIKLESAPLQDSLNLLLEHNFKINKIYHIFQIFENVITNDNSNQFDIIKSLISILILYPDILNEDELRNFISSYIIQKENKEGGSYFFDEKKNVALDFYLKISSDESNNTSLELTVDEIIQYLKRNNPDFSLEKGEIIKNQLEILKKL